MDDKHYSKTVPWLPHLHKEGNELCFICLLIYECTTFTSRVNVLNEKTVRTEGIQITLYFIMSFVSLVRQCCSMKGWFYINNIVDVKQKQTLHKWDPILKCE